MPQSSGTSSSRLISANGPEAAALKEAVADLTLENRLLKKSMTGAGDDRE